MANEAGRAADLVGVSASECFRDGGSHHTTLLIRKWEQDQSDWVAGRIDPDLVPLVRSGARTLQLRHFEAAGVAPYEELLHEGNVITTAGWAAWMASCTAATGPLFTATKGRLGVGDGTTAAAAGNTALQDVASITGAPNWILFGAAPTLTGGSPYVVTFPAVSYGSAIAVGAWNEFAVDSGTTNSGTVTATATAPMFNHFAAAAAFGTKSGSATWNATVTISFT